MNNRGQPFSTVQLFVVAVIALVILVLFLTIINSPSPSNTNRVTPAKVASDLVSSQVYSPGELRTSNQFYFPDGDWLSSKSIAWGIQVPNPEYIDVGTDLPASSVCLSKGKQENNLDFVLSRDIDRLTFVGTKTDSPFGAICEIFPFLYRTFVCPIKGYPYRIGGICGSSVEIRNGLTQNGFPSSYLEQSTCGPENPAVSTRCLVFMLDPN